MIVRTNQRDTQNIVWTEEYAQVPATKSIIPSAVAPILSFMSCAAQEEISSLHSATLSSYSLESILSLSESSSFIK